MSNMAQRSAKASLSHEERTATEPRNQGLHRVILDEVTTVNSTIRTLKFAIREPTGINVRLRNQEHLATQANRSTSSSRGNG